MDIAVRRAIPADLEAVVRLLYEVQEVHAQGRPHIFVRGGRKYSDSELLRIFADDRRPVLVAVQDGQVRGYAFCIYEETPAGSSLLPMKTLYIDDLCVDESCRGRHIGSRLYHAALNMARERGCDRVTLNVWSLNTGAMRFYEKCGLSPLKVTMEQKIP